MPIRPRSSAEVTDLVEATLDRMTVADKAGMMMHAMVVAGPDGTLMGFANAFGLPDTTEMVVDRRIRHFNLAGPINDAAAVARWHNTLQRLAHDSGPGIPVTLSSDPRHAFTENIGTSSRSGVFSQWPENLGFAAIGDEEVVRRFADTARREYLALGLRVSLHPQVDLVTEPRWSRAVGTFGESAELVGRLARAYITGFQGESFGVHSVSTMTKHFPGGGPQLDGEDPHFEYGKEQVYPSGRFRHHLEPFEAAIAAGTRQMMPYYGLPVGTEYDEIAFGFNKGVITDLLRSELGFEGIVCTDWGILNDSTVLGQALPARAWGVEHLSPAERAALALDAGVDQFGGEFDSDLLVSLVASGRISESRLDLSVRKLLAEKVLLGLFDDPYVDPERATAIAGHEEFVAAGEAAQRASVTVLERGAVGTAARLPLLPGIRVYAEGVTPEAVAAHAELVTDPSEADVIVVRLRAPFEERPGQFEKLFHAGSLEFPTAVLERLSSLAASAPVIVDVYLDRPAILTPVRAIATSLTVTFGVNDRAWMDVVFGISGTRARLPFDLPRSAAAVESSPSDAPFDTADPLFRFGHGVELTAHEHAAQLD